MIETVWQIVILLATNACTWFFGKLQTRREQKQTDLQIINQAVTPLLDSIKNLTEYNNRLVEQYMEEQRQRMEAQEENKSLKAERTQLAEQVSKLTAKVDKLERTIKKLTKDEDKDFTTGS